MNSHGKSPSFLVNSIKMANLPVLCWFTGPIGAEILLREFFVHGSDEIFIAERLSTLFPTIMEVENGCSNFSRAVEQ